MKKHKIVSGVKVRDRTLPKNYQSISQIPKILLPAGTLKLLTSQPHNKHILENLKPERVLKKGRKLSQRKTGSMLCDADSRQLEKNSWKPRNSLDIYETSIDENQKDSKWTRNFKRNLRKLQGPAHQSVPETSLYITHKHSRTRSQPDFSESHFEQLSLPVSGNDQHSSRLFLIDWMNMFAVSLSLTRQVYHLAVIYLDRFIASSKEQTRRWKLIGSGSLLLAINQIQRSKRNNFISLLSKLGMFSKKQLQQIQKRIIISLNFSLSFCTIAFWLHYFTDKWDSFIDYKNMKVQTCQGKTKTVFIKFKHSSGLSFKYYRELCELSDCLLMDPLHRQYQSHQLAFACLYLVLRVQIDIAASFHDAGQQNLHGMLHLTKTVWKKYYREFQMKISPIFRDPCFFNQLFDEFCCHSCNIELTKIIPIIKYVAKFIDLPFNYQIDSRSLASTNNYDRFCQLMTYSPAIKQHMLQHLTKEIESSSWLSNSKQL